MNSTLKRFIGLRLCTKPPYSAESAGKAYRSYSESIGAKDQETSISQVSTIQTN